VIAGLLMFALAGCGWIGDVKMGDCTGANYIHQGGSSTAVTIPRIPDGGPLLMVSGGHVSGPPPTSQLYLTVIPDGQDSGPPEPAKIVKLQVGESTTYLGFTVTVNGICGLQTYYSTTADDSLYQSPSDSPSPAPSASPTP